MLNENYPENMDQNQGTYYSNQGGSYYSQPGQNPYSSGNGDQPGQNPYSSGNDDRPKKNKKVLAVVLLCVAFVGLCLGISIVALTTTGGSTATESARLEESKEPEGTAEKEAEIEEPVIKEEETIKSSAEGAEITTVVTDVTEVVERVMPACVAITNQFTEITDFWGQSFEQDVESSGSGIIIGQNDTELLVVTNNHVVEDANTLYIQFIDGTVVEGQTKGTDSSIDLAVVAVKLDDIEEETKAEICVAQMGASDSLKLGEPVIAIGNALGYGQSVTTGVVSALNRTLEVDETGNSNALIQTDAAINPGNSGGALLNLNGEVIGINSSKIGGSTIEGMGYAIPISSAKPIMEELMSRETRLKVNDDEKGYLGISGVNVTNDAAEMYNLPLGVCIAQVYQGTGAEDAGLIRGDIITEMNGITISSMEDLQKCLAYYKAGETVTLTVMRGSAKGYQASEIEVTLCGLAVLEAAESMP